MTREGAVEVNAATGKKKRISKRIRDADFAKTEAPQPPEQAAQTIPGGAAPAPTAAAPPNKPQPKKHWIGCKRNTPYPAKTKNTANPVP